MGRERREKRKERRERGEERSERRETDRQRYEAGSKHLTYALSLAPCGPSGSALFSSLGPPITARLSFLYFSVNCQLQCATASPTAITEGASSHLKGTLTTFLKYINPLRGQGRATSGLSHLPSPEGRREAGGIQFLWPGGCAGWVGLLSSAGL